MPGLVGEGKRIGFCSFICEKLLEGFEQVWDMMEFAL